MLPSLSGSAEPAGSKVTVAFGRITVSEAEATATGARVATTP